MTPGNTETTDWSDLHKAALQGMQQMQDVFAGCAESVNRILETIVPRTLGDDFIAAMGLVRSPAQSMESALEAAGLTRSPWPANSTEIPPMVSRNGCAGNPSRRLPHRSLRAWA